MKRYLIALVALPLVGCGSITEPAAGVTSDGERYTGTATASIDAGTFEVASENGNKCSGTYDQFSTDRMLTVAFTCINGQAGTINIVRDPDLRGGEGIATFTDGTTGTFQFGRKRLGNIKQ